MNQRILTALAVTLTAAAAHAVDLAGRWEGAAVKGSATSPVVIEFQEVDGDWTGGVSFPRSGSLDFPIDSVTRKHDGLRFTYKSRGVMRAFQGQIDEDTLTGTFTMNGEKFETKLERKPAERPYTEEDVVYYNDDVKIAATLFVPKGEGPHPALVMLHGSGDNERYRYRFLADFYARLGIACLFGDKRGCGESGGDWRKVGFEPLAWDGIKGLEFLQERDDIDPDRIGMTGISQAGWIMTLAASLCDDVKFLVVNSGANVTVEEEGYFDYIVALRDKGWGEDVQQTARAVLELDNRVTRTGEGYDELREMIADIKDEPWRKDFDFFALPLKMRENSFYKKILDFDPRPYLEQNDIPVLWSYGAEDKSVKPEDSIAILEAVDKEFGKDYTINVYPGADHGLFVAPDPNVDALPLRVYAPGYLDDVAAWLNERVLGD